MSTIPKRADGSGYLIGSLIRIPREAIIARVGSELERTHPDVKAAYRPVFECLPPEGTMLVDLARRLGQSKQATKYIVDQLEKAGYLERVGHPRDGRANVIRRTDQGWEVNHLAQAVVEEVQEEWEAMLGAERMRTLLEALQEVAEHLGQPFRASVPAVARQRKSERPRGD